MESQVKTVTAGEMSPSVEHPRRAHAALTRLLGVALALAALFVCGGIPASVSLQRLVFERSAPPLPGGDAELRDAALDVLARGPSGVLRGARVRVLALRDEVEGRRAYAVGDAATGRDGHARLRALPRGQAWVSVDADGLARASTSLVLEAGERPVQLALEPEHRLDVEVKDERGTPLAGAEIEIAEADPMPVGARSGVDGVAHVGRLSAAPWAVTVRARGFDEVKTRGVHEGEPLRVVLHALGAILVHVVSDRGEGVPQARVQIASPMLWPARVADVRRRRRRADRRSPRRGRTRCGRRARSSRRRSSSAWMLARRGEARRDAPARAERDGGRARRG